MSEQKPIKDLSIKMHIQLQRRPNVLSGVSGQVFQFGCFAGVFREIVSSRVVF